MFFVCCEYLCFHFVDSICNLQVPGTANQVKVNDIVSFIENRFQVHLRMLLHGDIILYNEATTAPTQLQITMYPGGLAKVGLCKSVPSICLSAAIGDFEPTAIVNGNTKLFYDLKCQCVDRASGDYVDVPKFRVACGAVMPTEHTPLVLSVS